MIKITFPDGSVKEYAKGTTAYRIAESISPRLAADSLAASVNGATVDMTRPIETDASVKFYKWDDDEGQARLLAHFVAPAGRGPRGALPGHQVRHRPRHRKRLLLRRRFPRRRSPRPTFRESNRRCRRLSRNKEQLVRREVPKAEALRTFTEKGDQYKVEPDLGPRGRHHLLLYQRRVHGPLPRTAHPQYGLHQGAGSSPP